MPHPRVFGRYEVIDQLGEGGMGALYRARDPLIGRTVAIKQLRAAYDTPELRDRFSREARAAGCLSHPNIVTIYDVGEQDGLPFIAMEYVRGETFAHLVTMRPPLPLARKLQLIEEVCAGLAHAHEAGIVHRDIKPANLIVGAEGTVKILDFGIAKLDASGLTSPGTVLGTLNYMSPEQVKGLAVDARADIFSLGAVLYELVSQQLAFPGKAYTDVLRLILGGEPRPITEHCPGLDPRLVRAIDTALQRDPAIRYQDVSQMQRELAAIRLNPLDAPRGAIGRGSPRPDDDSAPAGPPAGPPGRTEGPNAPSADAVRRRRLVDAHLAAAREAFVANDYESALASCKEVLLLDPSEERALSEMVRIQNAIDEAHLQAQLAEARRHLSAGAYTLALHVLDDAASESPDHPELIALRSLVLAERDRARAAVIESGTRRARAELERNNPDAAVREAERVLSLAPGHAGALAVKAAAEAKVGRRAEEARLAAAVEGARRSFANGNHRAALGTLEALDPGAHPQVAQALEELRRAWAEIEAQRREEAERAEKARQLAATLQAARAALAADRLDEARRLVEDARGMDPGARELPALDDQLQRAEAAARQRIELARLLEAFSDSLARGDLAQAGEIVGHASILAPGDASVTAARDELDRAAKALAEREAAEARRREGEERLDEAAARLGDGDLEGAAERLAAAALLVPDHGRASELGGRLQEAIARRDAERAAEQRRQQVAALVRSASDRLRDSGTDAGELVTAVREVKEALALDPQNAEAASLKASLDTALAALREAARVKTVIENARRRFANGKHQAAVRLLEEAQPSSSPEIASALAELRAAIAEIETKRQAEREQADKAKRLAAALAEAANELGRNRLDAAATLFAAAGEIDPEAAQASGIGERIGKARADAERRAAVDRLFVDEQQAESRAEWPAARDLLAEVAALDPADARLLSARQRVDAAIAAAEQAEVRALERDNEFAAAEQALERGDLAAAQEALARAATIDPQHSRLSDLTGRVERQLSERRAVEEAAERRRTSDGLLDEAERLLAPGSEANPLLALRKVTESQGLVPDDPRAVTLKVKADEALAAQREAARIESAIRNARARFANGKHQAAVHLLESLGAAAAPAVADALAEMRSALAAIAEERRLSQPSTAVEGDMAPAASKVGEPGDAEHVPAAAVAPFDATVLLPARRPSQAAAPVPAPPAASLPAVSPPAPAAVGFEGADATVFVATPDALEPAVVPQPLPAWVWVAIGAAMGLVIVLVVFLLLR